MKHIFENSFFFIESNKLECFDGEVQTYVIDFGIREEYRHRTYEWKHCHKDNIFEVAYNKLADILVAYGYDVDIDDNWLRIYTTDETAGFTDVKQIITDNHDWLYEMFDI